MGETMGATMDEWSTKSETEGEKNNRNRLLATAWIQITNYQKQNITKRNKMKNQITEMAQNH